MMKERVVNREGDEKREVNGRKQWALEQWALEQWALEQWALEQWALEQWALEQWAGKSRTVEIQVLGLRFQQKKHQSLKQNTQEPHLEEESRS
jgi:hypothetical protein